MDSQLSFELPTETESFYGVGFSCRPSYSTQMKSSNFDPYEPYNENVFESNEDNILDDAEYVYDYLNLVLGIQE
jgi:ABC-type transporter lipoprotein component MlaA